MPLNPAELEPLLRLALIDGIGHLRLAKLMDRFGHPEAVIRASSIDLRAVQGMGADLISRIRAAGSLAAKRDTERALRRLAEVDALALRRDDPLYPAPFLELPDPPYLIFASGDLTLLRQPAIAMVGTRSPTPYGRSVTAQLSRDLALAGVAIVSGMARGIDSAAHAGALDAGGPTIGVLGHGIEQVYPPEASRLFSRVRAAGLLLTEYPPGETPKAGNFPRRNRLITVLSRGVVVVEMGLRSGAQHSVNYALEQGREVFAVPGPVGSPASEGTNQLIKDGARMITSAADVLEELFGVGSARAASAAPTGAGADLSSLDAGERRILETLGAQPVTVDAIARAAGVQAAELLATLLDLELRGLVRSAPGQRYVRAHLGS